MRNTRIYFNESKSSKTTNRLIESSSSEEFTYEVDGNEYKFVCTTVGTKEGFAHRAKLYKNGDILVSARCDYLNRTWETFRYQSCMRKAVEKAIRVHEELSDELSALKRKIDGEDEQEVESPKMPNEDIKEALNKRITTLSKKQRTS